MLNLSVERNTKPCDITQELTINMHEENLKVIHQMADKYLLLIYQSLLEMG